MFPSNRPASNPPYGHTPISQNGSIAPVYILLWRNGSAWILARGLFVKLEYLIFYKAEPILQRLKRITPTMTLSNRTFIIATGAVVITAWMFRWEITPSSGTGPQAAIYFKLDRLTGTSYHCSISTCIESD